jgi:FkbM family methyltransferase
MAGIIKQTLNPQLYWYLLQGFNEVIDGFMHKSYSLEGEDMVLRRIFDDQPTGFYIDVGAHHPKRFSNTYYFYSKGWKGINIDCTPGSMFRFKYRRRKDINLEFAISDRFERLKFHKYDEPAMNTFLPDQVSSRLNEKRLLNTVEINSVTLEYVLDKYLPKDVQIDFLSIDVEGMDLKVLHSNNWNRYRPKVVLVEDLSNNDTFISDSEIVRFMESMEYVLYAKTLKTFIFREKYFVRH